MDRPELPAAADLARLAQGLAVVPAFDLVLRQVSYDAFRAWTATAPHQIAEREQAWNRYKAVEEIRSQIATWSKAK